MRTWRGGCLCGATRFAARGVPGRPHACACRMCRRHTGAPVAAWVEFPAGAVEWSRPPALWRSSPASSRAFCGACASSLGAVDDAPVVALLVGAFDRAGDAALAPRSQSFRASRPRWCGAGWGA